LLVLPDVIHRRDPRMMQLGDRLRFAPEPGNAPFRPQRPAENLERDDPVERDVASPIHHAHAPGPHPLLNAECPDQRVRFEIHGRIADYQIRWMPYASSAASEMTNETFSANACATSKRSNG